MPKTNIKSLSRFIHWDSKRILGIEEMDKEHKFLAGILNELYDYIIYSETVCRIHTKLMLEKLYIHSKEHFSNEEQIMQSHSYPKLRLHKQEHYYLLVELKDYIREFNLGELKFTERTLSQLKTWYLVHIHTSDKEFAEHYHNSNLESFNDAKITRANYPISKY